MSIHCFKTAKGNLVKYFNVLFGNVLLETKGDRIDVVVLIKTELLS